MAGGVGDVEGVGVGGGAVAALGCVETAVWGVGRGARSDGAIDAGSAVAGRS